ncbi:MAG TPA: cytochrome c [Solirubrobacteraceae bacterium]|nr:cytochrome c [Solirubrobacteraceae bacterium]
MPRRRIALAIAPLALSAVLVACGTEGVSVPKSDAVVHRGAVIFSQRCSGCHTLEAAGTQGSATKVRDKERTDGPDLDQRKETKDQVLYAIRNGGFSGAIMPENIVVGKDAQAVAEFVAKYAGDKAHPPKGPGQ